jgi:hypothetical protein
VLALGAVPTHVETSFAAFLGEALGSALLALNVTQGATKGGLPQSAAGEATGVANPLLAGNGKHDGGLPGSGTGGPPAHDGLLDSGADKTTHRAGSGPTLAAAAVPTHTGDPLASFLGETLAAMFLALRGGGSSSIENTILASTGNGKKGDGGLGGSGTGGPPQHDGVLKS